MAGPERPGRVRYRFRMPITDPEDLRLFTESAFGVRVPATAVCPGHSSPWEAFVEAYFARARVAVWHGSRGFSGKSTLLALLGLTEAVTLKAEVTIFGGSGLQSQRVHQAQVAMWNHPGAPRGRLVGDPLRRITRLTTGNEIQALTASTRAARGRHVSRMRVDEVDEIGWDLLQAVMGQTQSLVHPTRAIPAQTVLSSTRQYADGTMARVLKMAAERGWAKREWCWKETISPHGWLAPEEVAAKRTEVTDQVWTTEYDLQEPNPEDRAFAPAAVAALFRRESGIHAGNEYAEFESPIRGAVYATGADWAREVDWTVLVTVRADSLPVRVVAWERMQRLPWPVMLARLEERLRRYPGAAAHDATGLGAALGADGGFIAVPPGSLLEDVVLQGRTRADLVSQYLLAIEHGHVAAPWIAVAEAEHRYAGLRDIYGPGHLPDTICALALAWRAAGRPTVDAATLAAAPTRGLVLPADEVTGDFLLGRRPVDDDWRT